MQAPLGFWRSEHRNFRRLLALMEQEIEQFKNGESPNYQLLQDIVYYLTHYPDSCHHPAEDSFFKALLSSEPALQPQLEDLYRQHRQLADDGQQLSALLESVVEGGLVPRRALVEPAERYIAYYRCHMSDEEERLFPVAEQRLRDAGSSGVPRFEPVADPLFGDAPVERFRTLHRQIAESADCDCEIAPAAK